MCVDLGFTVSDEEWSKISEALLGKDKVRLEDQNEFVVRNSDFFTTLHSMVLKDKHQQQSYRKLLSSSPKLRFPNKGTSLEDHMKVRIFVDGMA